MDINEPKDNKTSVSDNRNSSDTNPPLKVLPTNNFEDTKSIIGPASNDPTAPHKADPLNGAVPDHSATDISDVIELKSEIGGTGTIIIGGILVESDYNPDFTGRGRVRIYDEMRLSEPKLRLGLGAIKYPIIASRWTIKPGKGDVPNSPRVQFLAQELFQNPNFSFTQFLRQALSYCDYGNMFFEKVFRMRRDGMVGWKKFAPRLPNTIWRYTLNDGLTPGITQILPTGGVTEIPLWKLLPFILDMEGSNYEGHSLLRYAYKPYFYKNLYQKIDAIAAERQGCGVPIINVPAQATPADKARAKVIAKNLRVNEYAYVDLPVGFTLTYIDTHAKTLKDLSTSIENCNRDMLDAFHASFLDLGSKSSGSKSLSADQSDLFYLTVQYIAKVYQEPVQLAGNELIDLNFSNTKVDEYPTIEFSGLGNVDLQKYGIFLQAAVGSGALIPDDTLEAFLRDIAEMPESERISSGEDVDPVLRKIGPPPMPAIVNGKTGNQPAKPNKPMLNSEHRREQFLFNEAVADMYELHARIGEAIEKKKPINL